MFSTSGQRKQFSKIFNDGVSFSLGFLMGCPSFVAVYKINQFNTILLVKPLFVPPFLKRYQLRYQDAESYA